MASLMRLGACCVLVALFLSRESSGAATAHAEGDASTNSVLTEDEVEAALSERGSRGSLTQTSSNGGSSPGSSVVLAEIARELIGRSATSSQVLSLNLTNLVILLVLKAIIFGAGSMGFGWAGHKARSGGNENEAAGGLVSEQELLLGLSYLVDNEGRCLNRVACQEPEAASAYARAANLLAGGARLLSGVMPYDTKYDSVLEGLQDAVEFGRNGSRCETRYSCVSS